ncbi:MAG: hypothetical protein WBY44_03600 [Bryobacteraceae bacterium]
MTNKTVKTTKNTKATVTAPVTPEPKPAILATALPKKKIAAAPAPVAAIAEATSKRITPGAAIAEWRVVRSQRTAQAGFFLQGGHFEMMPNGRNHFVCGAELFFEDRAAAFGALAERKTPAAA